MSSHVPECRAASKLGGIYAPVRFSIVALDKLVHKGAIMDTNKALLVIKSRPQKLLRLRNIALLNIIIFSQVGQLANSASLCDPDESVTPTADEFIGNTLQIPGEYRSQLPIRDFRSQLRYLGQTSSALSISSQFSRFPEAEQTVRPVPIEEVIIDAKKSVQKIERAKVDTCVSAINRLQGIGAIAGSKDYACALLSMDTNCLTSHDGQKNVPDPSIPRRAIVVMSIKGVAFCTGIFLDKTTIATARHCFINESNGKLRPQFNAPGEMDLDINSLDMKRTAVVDHSSIRSLVLNSAFDIDKDPVKIAVTVRETPGASPLPEVKFTTPVRDQLMWIAGPFALLDQAIAMRNAAAHPETPAPPIRWEDAVRWSAQDSAQCRVKTVTKECIYHTCQTSEGFSGSPMIVSAQAVGTNAIIEIVGIHSGTPGNIDSGGWSACSKSTPEFKASNFSAYNVGKNGGF